MKTFCNAFEKTFSEDELKRIKRAHKTLKLKMEGVLENDRENFTRIYTKLNPILGHPTNKQLLANVEREMDEFLTAASNDHFEYVEMTSQSVFLGVKCLFICRILAKLI